MSSPQSPIPKLVLLLPLPDLAHIQDPTPYLPSVRLAAQSTTSRLLILFYGDALRNSGVEIQWNDMQRFLGNVYGTVSQVAAAEERVLMEIDVVVEGFTAGQQKVVGQWDGMMYPEDAREPLPTYAFGQTNDSDRIGTPAPETTLLAQAPTTSYPLPPIRLPSSSFTSSTRKQDGPTLYPVVALGGTFDHLHAGHKILLSMAVWIASRKIIVGVSADELLKKKSHPQFLEPIPLRIQNVATYLASLDPTLELDIVPLHDVAGPTGDEEDIQALVVSRESIEGGDMIDAPNGSVAKIRQDRHLPPLRQFIIDVISSSDPSANPSVLTSGNPSELKQLKMGSTYIRGWLAGRDGAA